MTVKSCKGHSSFTKSKCFILSWLQEVNSNLVKQLQHECQKLNPYNTCPVNRLMRQPRNRQTYMCLSRSREIVIYFILKLLIRYLENEKFLKESSKPPTVL